MRMPKPLTIAIVVGAVVVIGGGAILAVNLLGGGANNNATVKIVDPEGTYNFFSDPSVTSYPEKNAVFGNGQSLAFEYDGSKTNKDMTATLSYQLYYVQEDGKVQPMGGGNLSGLGAGPFSTSSKVFNSAASGASGFFELIATYDTKADENGHITGKNVPLGMYPIKFEVAQ
jgi:hypothetical protein